MRGKMVGKMLVICKNHSKSKILREYSSPLCQTYTPTVVLKHKPNIGPPHMRQVFHPRPQTSQRKSVAKSETLLIILSLICPIRSENREVDKNRKSRQWINVLCSKNMDNIQRRTTTSARKGQATINHPITQTCKCKWHTPSVRHLNVNYISIHK